MTVPRSSRICPRSKGANTVRPSVILVTIATYGRSTVAALAGDAERRTGKSPGGRKKDLRHGFAPLPMEIDVLDRGAGKLTVQQLADELGVSVTDASQHLRYLRDALIVRGRRRGRTTCYRVIDKRPLDIYKRAIECVKEPRLEPAREAA
jgi:DNA-binding transcriptional ArsR family regulator